MSDEMPEEFETDEELVEWFESADLVSYTLEQAHEVVVASHVELSVEPPAEQHLPSAGQTGSGILKYEPVP